MTFPTRNCEVDAAFAITRVFWKANSALCDVQLQASSRCFRHRFLFFYFPLFVEFDSSMIYIWVSLFCISFLVSFFSPNLAQYSCSRLVASGASSSGPQGIRHPTYITNLTFEHKKLSFQISIGAVNTLVIIRYYYK